jgi:type II secretory pathway component PulC
MDLTTQRRLLTTMTAGFLAVAAGGLVWSSRGIDETADPLARATGSSIARQASVPSPLSTGSTAKANMDFSLPLQRPLVDPPEPPPPPRPSPVVKRPPKPPVKKTNLDWTLTGTIIDADRSVAILTDAAGKTDIRGTGEEVELSPPGVLVRSIASDAVTLEVRGRESTLRLEQSFGPDRGNDDGARQGRRRNR